MKLIVTITAFLFINLTGLSYNSRWVNMDKRLIKRVVELNRSDPKSVEMFFRQPTINKTKKKNLGFGWSKLELTKRGGYISISVTFFYFHDSIVSYEIYPNLPYEPELNEVYKKWYRDSFTYTSIESHYYSDSLSHPVFEILPFEFNQQNILKPLKEYKGSLTTKDVSTNVLEFMSPNGYLTFRGQSLSHLNDYYKIKDSLTNDLAIFIMYSINPVTRLTGIIYYLNHKNLFSEQQMLDDWVERNYIEDLTIRTQSGCIVNEENFRIVIMKCTNGK